MKFAEDLGELGFCVGDKNIRAALTVRSLKNDDERVILLDLLKAKVEPSDLRFCFMFLLTRNNQKGDEEVLLCLLKAGVRAKDLPACAELLAYNGNQPQQYYPLNQEDILALMDAGLKPKNLVETLEIMTYSGGLA